MSKVLIVTNYKSTANYGALLQAYALNRVMSQICTKCETLNWKIEPTRSRMVKRYFKRITNYGLQGLLEYVKQDFYKTLVRSLIHKRISALDTFRNSIPHSVEYSMSHISKIEKEYDILLCGSDQIWRPTKEKELIEVYWLSYFSPSVVKASYAASLGVERLPKHLEQAAIDNILNLDFVSVREEEANHYLTKLSKREDILTVIDPVFLLTRQQWLEIIEQPIINQPYILVYLIHSNKSILSTISEYAMRKHLKIVTFPYMAYQYKSCEKGFGDIRDFTSTPNQFLGLLKNSECVFTDSFHATAFSIIFKTRFFVASSNELAISRISNLMKKMETQKCVIPKTGLDYEGYNQDTNLNWDLIEETIAREKEIAIEYLHRVITFEKKVLS